MKIFEMNFMKVYYMMLKSFISWGIFYKLFVYKEFVWIVVICMFFFFFIDEEKIIFVMFRVCVFFVSILGIII